MKEINLKHIYPHYKMDHILLVDDMVAELLESYRRAEMSQLRKQFRHKAHYSLDLDDGIETLTLNSTLTPADIYERSEMFKSLYDALKLLPPTQAKRIYAYYILNIRKTDIAAFEGVSVRAICTSIQRGLNRLDAIMLEWR